MDWVVGCKGSVDMEFVERAVVAAVPVDGCLTFMFNNS